MKNKVRNKIDIRSLTFNISMLVCFFGVFTDYFAYFLITAIIINFIVSIYEIKILAKKKQNIEDEQTYLGE